MERSEVFTDIDKWVHEVNSKPAYKARTRPIIIEVPDQVAGIQTPVFDTGPGTARNLAEAVDPDVERLLRAERIRVNYGQSRVMNRDQHQIKSKQIQDRSRQLKLQAADRQAEILAVIDSAYQPVVKAALEPNNGHDVTLEEIEFRTGVFEARLKVIFRSRDLRQKLAIALGPQDIVPLTENYFDPGDKFGIPERKKIPESAVNPGFSKIKSPDMPRLMLGTIVFVHVQDAEDYLNFRNISRVEKKK